MATVIAPMADTLLIPPAALFFRVFGLETFMGVISDMVLSRARVNARSSMKDAVSWVVVWEVSNKMSALANDS